MRKLMNLFESDISISDTHYLNMSVRYSKSKTYKKMVEGLGRCLIQNAIGDVILNTDPWFEREQLEVSDDEKQKLIKIANWDNDRLIKNSTILSDMGYKEEVKYIVDRYAQADLIQDFDFSGQNDLEVLSILGISVETYSDDLKCFLGAI